MLHEWHESKAISVTDHFVVQHRDWFGSLIISDVPSQRIVLGFDVVLFFFSYCYRLLRRRRLCILNIETWDATFDPIHTATKQQVL